MNKYLLLCTIFLVNISCSKEVGKGGNSSIQGRIYGYDINSEGEVKGSGYVGEYDVYISYGDNIWIDDKTITSPSGDYIFENLQKGDYTLFAYSQCNECIFNKETISKSISITKNKEKIILEDIIIKD